MTTQTVIEKVRAELGPLDARAEQAVLTTFKVMQDAAFVDMPVFSRDDAFVGENITLAKYVALPREKRRHYQDEAERINQRWLATQFEKLNARWLMVIDGQIALYGETLDNFPDHEELLALCQKTGKYPFAFLSPRVFEIEEISTLWHFTKEPDDAYPAVAVTLTGNLNAVSTEADFDTGAVDCFASLELLLQNGIVKIQPEDLEWTSRHLSRSFIYFPFHFGSS